MDGMDLFEDHPSFDAQAELDKINKELLENTRKCQTLTEEIVKLQQKNAKLEETQLAIKRNFNTLLSVARHEIIEKDNRIIALRREKDDLAFRRVDTDEIKPTTIVKFRANQRSRGSQTKTLEELFHDPSLALGYEKPEQSQVNGTEEKSRIGKPDAIVPQSSNLDKRHNSRACRQPDVSEQARDNNRQNRRSNGKDHRGSLSEGNRKRTLNDRNDHREDHEDAGDSKSRSREDSDNRKRTQNSHHEESSDKKSSGNVSDKRKRRQSCLRASPNDKSSSDVDQPAKKSRNESLKRSDERKTDSPERSVQKTIPLAIKVEHVKTETTSSPGLLSEDEIKSEMEKIHNSPSNIVPSPDPHIPNPQWLEEEVSSLSPASLDILPESDPVPDPSNAPASQEIESSPNPVTVEESIAPPPPPIDNEIPPPPLPTIPPVSEPEPRIEKRTEPLLTTFEGSLKLLDKEGLFVKIQSNRTPSSATEDTSMTATKPLDGINSSSSGNELHLQVSDHCSLSPPMLNQKVMISPAVEETTENEKQSGATEAQQMITTVQQFQVILPFETEPPLTTAKKPQNNHPHNNPVKNKLPMMKVPQTADAVPKEIPVVAPEVVAVVDVVKPAPAPKPRFKFIPKYDDVPKNHSNSNLTEANLQEHDLNNKKVEVQELADEFKQILSDDDPLVIMANKRKEERVQKMKHKLPTADLVAPSTVAPSHLNADLVGFDKSKEVKDIPAKQSDEKKQPVLSPNNPKENTTLNQSVKLEDSVRIEPPAEKCVLLGNSQYNISKDSEGTTVIHLKRFKKRTK